MSLFRQARHLLAAVLVLVYGIEGKIIAQNEIGSAGQQSPRISVPVGMVGKIDQIVISGGELEAVPNTDPLAKMIVRVAESYRHGDAYRYDLEFTGFEPGRYDLSEYLRRKAPETSPTNLPSIDVEIVSVLEPGRIEPARPAQPEIRSWWTYWTKLNLFIGLWIAGLAGLFHWSNRVKKVESPSQEKIPPLTVAQRLKPLVQAACDGTIESHKRAELESLLIAYWTSRSDTYAEISPGHILSKLKLDPEAGPLLTRLEEWLHMPPGQGRSSEGEIAQLLKPYESVPDSENSGIGMVKGDR